MKNNAPRRLALLGNPNVGKSTLFNALTGSSQYVGNWPGVTVARKSGRTSTGSELVDLPGVYSLRPCSPEEAVTRRFLLEELPDGIIQVADGSNLERSLYLTLQLMSLGLPLVLAVNLTDVLKKQGIRLDCARLQEELGLPVIPISARNGENLDVLLNAAEQAGPCPPPPWEPDTARTLRRLEALLEEHCPFPTFQAERLLEGDAAQQLPPEVRCRAEELIRAWEGKGDRAVKAAEGRYRWSEAAVRRCLSGQQRRERPSRLDRLLLGRWSAFPCLGLALLLLCWVTFGPPGQTLSQWLGVLLSWLAAPLERLLPEGWWKGLLLEGFLGGLEGVLAFLPQISLLFLCLTLLEDSGYMARAALLMDRPLGLLGLPGKAFIPMLMGLGCTVPAVMAARTLEREQDRRVVALTVPLIPCSARLPVCALVAGAYFPARAGVVIPALCLLGVSAALLSGALLRRTLFRGQEAPFVLELPAYRLPGAGAVLRHVWEKCRGFLVKAGTVIVAMNGAIWLCRSLTPALRPAADPGGSILARIGGQLALLLEPLGFGDPTAAAALLSGLAAKEAVAGTLTILTGGVLPFTPAAALSFLVFALLYTPCVSTLAVLRREMGLRWALGSAVLSTAAAWGSAWAAYRLALGVPIAPRWLLPAAALLLAALLLKPSRCSRCSGCSACQGRAGE